MDCTNCKYFVSNADVCLPNYCRLHRVELDFCTGGLQGNYCDNYTEGSAMKRFTFVYIAPDGERTSYTTYASNQGIAIANFKKNIYYKKILSITKSKATSD